MQSVGGGGGVGGGTGVSSDAAASSLVKLRSHALSLQTRLSELADKLAQVRDGVGPARHMDASAFYAKFETVAQLGAQFGRELRDSGIEAYVALPTREAGALEAGAVPEMLRTQRDREAEREDRARAAAFDGDKSHRALAKRLVAHNNAVTSLLDTVQDLAEEHALDPLVIPQRPRPPPAANAILAALSSGAGL